MDSFAYDHGLPCLNPHCKSHGRPHPNCTCYSGNHQYPGEQFAEGDDVHYCSNKQPHKTGCQYYQEGGSVEVPPEDMPTSQEVPPEDMPVQVGKEVPTDDMPTDYSTPEQQVKTTAEGLAQGVAGPAATWGEINVLGVDPADIAGRQEAHPIEHGLAETAGLAGSLMTGVGEAGLLAKAVPEISAFGKVGSAIFKGALESGLIQGGDEVTKGMIGQADPEAPVSSALAHMGAAALLGGITGGAFNLTSRGGQAGLQALENAKIGTKADNLMAGMGMAAKAHQDGIPADKAEEYILDKLSQGTRQTAGNLKPASFKEVPFQTPNLNDYKLGIKLYYSGVKGVSKNIARTIGAGVGGAAGSVLGIPGEAGGAAIGVAIANKHLTPILEKVLNRPLIGTSKLIMPVVMNAMAKGKTAGLLDAINYATKVSKGAKLINDGIEAVFRSGSQQTIDAYTSELNREKISRFIDKGGVDQQLKNEAQDTDNETPQFAKGGMVQTPPAIDHFGELYPEQNTMLNAAKARVSGYLNSVKPRENPIGLAFDRKQDISKEARSKYNRAIDMADKPLGILKHIKDGTLTTEHMQHFNSMYPELGQHLQKRLTERVLKSSLNEEKPPFKTIQALSMFLGAPLESTMTPANIQVAQGVFAPKQSPQQPQPAKNKRGTSNLGKSNKSYETPNQAGEADQSKRN